MKLFVYYGICSLIHLFIISVLVIKDTDARAREVYRFKKMFFKGAWWRPLFIPIFIFVIAVIWPATIYWWLEEKFKWPATIYRWLEEKFKPSDAEEEAALAHRKKKKVDGSNTASE